MKKKLAAEAALEAAKALVGGLAAPMAMADVVLDMVSGARGMGLKDLIDPTTRQARLLAVQLGGDPGALARLQEARRAYDGLRQAVGRVRSLEDAPAVEKASFPLSGFEAECRAHPLLRMLWPRGGPT